MARDLRVRKEYTNEINPPVNLVEEDKWMLAVISFEASKSVFIKLMRTTLVQLLHQVIGLPKKLKKLLTH